MTVRKKGYIPVYTGLATDVRPTVESESTRYLPVGTEFIELDSGEKHIFDGAGTWYSEYANKYYLGSRTGITITTTSSHLFSGGTLTQYGDLLRQYTVSLSASTNTPTRTVSITDSNSVTVWTSTALTGTTGTASMTRLLPTSEQVVLDGAYSVVWTLSTNSATTGITDYVTFGFDRG